MGRSLFFIKPDGMLSAASIQREIQFSSRLEIVASFQARLEQRHVAMLYGNLAQAQSALWFVTLGHLMSGPCQVCIVEGERAIERLVTVCGAQTNPFNCALGTIRRNHCKDVRVVLEDGLIYYLNVVHRPRDQAEFERDMQLARHLAPPGTLR